MGAIYTLSRSNVVMNTSNDLLTIIAEATRRLRLRSVECAGMGTTSAAAEVGIYLSTGGTTPGGAVTAKPWLTDQEAAGFTNATTWAAQPSLSGDPYWRLGFNANGGINRWIWTPAFGEQIEFRNSEQCSIRPNLGTINMSLTVVVEAIP